MSLFEKLKETRDNFRKLEHSNNEQKRLIASKQVTKSIRDMVFKFDLFFI